MSGKLMLLRTVHNTNIVRCRSNFDPDFQILAPNGVGFGARSGQVNPQLQR